MKKFLDLFKFKKDLELHEILKEGFEGAIVQDREGNKYQVYSTDWSGFNVVCLNDKNEPIKILKIKRDTQEAYFTEKRRMLGYYNKGYKVVSTGK